MASNKKLYVGNLSHDIDNNELKNVFQPYGEVVSAQVIMDRDIGRSKGFGFVEMDSEDAGNAAIEALNGTELKGQRLRINVARPPQERTGGFGGERRGGPRGGGFGGPRSGGFGGGRNRF